FLMIFTRAWELGAGAILALSDSDSKAVGKFGTYCAAVGLSLIIFAYWYPDYFGNNLAITETIPVVGSMLIIRFSNEANIVGRLLSIRPLSIIGLSSYSIYLWHQPILSFLRLSLRTPPSYLTLVFFASLSIPVALISWRYVESVLQNK